MKNKYQFFFLIAGIALLFSCNNVDELKIPAYLDWVNDPTNGLKVAKELNDYKFELFYKPVEFVAIKEQRKTDIDTALYHQRITELNGLQYYTLRIETLIGQEMMRTGIGSEQDYSNRLQYFSDLAQYDMRLIDGSDTLSCVLFHFERNYGVAPYNNIVLGFPKTEGNTNSKTFIFDEQVLGVGRVNLKIANTDINNIPKVILI